MEFDKNKILTPITVDQFVEEQIGWVDDDVEWLEDSVRKEKPQLVTLDKSAIDYPFKIGDSSWRYFYPAPETSYRPFNNDELNELVGEVLTNRQSGRRKLVTGKPTASEGVNLDGSYINAKDLLASFYRNGNEPCGVKEEA